MSKKVKMKKLSPVGKMLKDHKSGCAFWTFHGDRHCSCGRDEAILQMQAARFLMGEDLFKRIFGEVFGGPVET